MCSYVPLYLYLPPLYLYLSLLIKFIFALAYVPLCAVKGKAFTYFLSQHLCVEVEEVLAEVNQYVGLQPWVLMFGGFKTL